MYCQDNNVNTFNQLRHIVYYKKSKELDLKKLSAISSSALLHIERAYLQTYIWLHSTFMESIEITPLEYGYELEDDDEEVMTPKITRNITRRTTNALQVCEMRKIKCMHLSC